MLPIPPGGSSPPEATEGGLGATARGGEGRAEELCTDWLCHLGHVLIPPGGISFLAVKGTERTGWLLRAPGVLKDMENREGRSTH